MDDAWPDCRICFLVDGKRYWERKTRVFISWRCLFAWWEWDSLMAAEQMFGVVSFSNKNGFEEM